MVTQLWHPPILEPVLGGNMCIATPCSRPLEALAHREFLTLWRTMPRIGVLTTAVATGCAQERQRPLPHTVMT